MLGGGHMAAAVLASFLETAVKFLFFFFLALGGIFCGKKYRDYRDSKNPGDKIQETNK